jgi:hypothetical protein
LRGCFRAPIGKRGHIYIVDTDAAEGFGVPEKEVKIPHAQVHADDDIINAGDHRFLRLIDDPRAQQTDQIARPGRTAASSI